MVYRMFCFGMSTMIDFTCKWIHSYNVPWDELLLNHFQRKFISMKKEKRSRYHIAYLWVYCIYVAVHMCLCTDAVPLSFWSLGMMKKKLEWMGVKVVCDEGFHHHFYLFRFTHNHTHAHTTIGWEMGKKRSLKRNTKPTNVLTQLFSETRSTNDDDRY